ncbi:MAG: hypothetical protein Q9180_005365 [Flavoplaca navasiana]
MDPDTHRSFGEIWEQSGEAFQTALLEIQECTTQRKEELEWLHRMRFLAPILDFSDEEFEQVSCSYSLPTTRSLAVSSFFTVSTTRNNCKCSRAPTFKGYERQFRLTAPGEFDGCSHYVAISYCWHRRPHQDGFVVSRDESYSIETKDGVKAGKAPFDVIDRAVAFAAIHHAGLIWIDQEVIDQTDPTDVAQGIQVMDMVYERSSYPLAILDTKIRSQAELDTLHHILSESHSIATTNDDEDNLQNDDNEDISDASVEMDKEDYITNVEGSSTEDTSSPCLEYRSSCEAEDSIECEFSETVSGLKSNIGNHAAILENLLRSLAEDLYFTRAWTLHEHLTALNMSISMRIDPQLNIPSGHLEALRGTEVFFSMAELGEQIESFSELNDRTFGRYKPSSLRVMVDHYSSVLDPSFETEARRVARSAAEVLALLDSRGNSVVSDRLAIVANLCSYDVRLNAKELERRQRSFSTCVLALALLNGDLSLLTGYGSASDGLTEVHLILEDIGPARDPFGWGWCPPKHGRLKFLPCTIAAPQDDTPLRIGPSLLTAAGLRTSGFVWRRSQVLDFREFKSSQADFLERDHLEGTFWKRRQRMIWDILLSLAGRGYQTLAEALWRFQFYDGDSIQYGKPDYRPYHLEKLLDLHTLRIKDFGDPKSTASNNYKALFRESAFESSLPDKVLAESAIETFQCTSSDDSQAARAWFNFDKLGEVCDPDSIDGVFIPWVRSSNEQYNSDPHYVTIGWCIRQSDSNFDGVEILKCCGKVEGFWNIDGLDPKQFILA